MEGSFKLRHNASANGLHHARSLEGECIVLFAKFFLRVGGGKDSHIENMLWKGVPGQTVSRLCHCHHDVLTIASKRVNPHL